MDFEKPRIVALTVDVWMMSWVMSQHQSCQCRGSHLMSQHRKSVGLFSIFNDNSMS